MKNGSRKLNFHFVLVALLLAVLCTITSNKVKGSYQPRCGDTKWSDAEIFQTPTTSDTTKGWKMLGESNTQVDVSYRIINCSSVNQVHLYIFNENSLDQTTKFDLLVSNKNGQNFTKSIVFPLIKGRMYKADCSSTGTTNNLKIDLPAGYDATNTTLKITFKP